MTQTSCPLGLLDLPNCVIVQLLSYLDAGTLYYLSKCCTRLDELIKNHSSLWRFIDARRCPKGPQTRKRDFVEYCVKRGHRDTHTFLIRADSEQVMPCDFFSNVCKFENLRILALEHQLITNDSIKDFPQQLRELSLRRSVVNEKDFFMHSNHHMKNLRVLVLDECDWFAASALMPVSKYENLEILSVYKCKNLDNSIPYISLAGQFGFRNLKIFDARLTSIGNTLIHSMYRSKSLLAIYLQNDDISYKLDYFKRKLEILEGATARSHNFDEFDLNEPQNNEENGSSYHTFSDRDLLDYLSIDSTELSVALPKSFLYLDPYSACTCGFEDRQKDKPKAKRKPPSNGYDSSNDSDDDQGGGGGDSLIDRTRTKIEGLSRTIRRTQGSSSVNLRGPKFFPNFQYDPEGDHWIIKININAPEAPRMELVDSNELHKRLREDYDEPQSKRAKTEDDDDDAEPTPGPSGMRQVEVEVDEESESEPEDYQPVLDRPPTPHPDVAVNMHHDPDFEMFPPVVHVEDFLRSMERIKTQVPLQRLSLRGYSGVTNSALSYIKNLNLEVLDLTYTNVTKGAIDKYLKSHPLCRVVHESFCVCPTNLHF